MPGAALRDDEFIDVSKLFEFSADQVPHLAENIGGIQRPILAMPAGGASFDLGRLTTEDRGKIPLANPRPLVLRSNFQDADKFIDHLGLTKIVNDSLREASFRGRDATLIFVDAIEFPGAYSLAGRYRLINEKLNVMVRIFKGEAKIGEFKIDGDRNALHQLIDDLLQNTEKQISISNREFEG